METVSDCHLAGLESRMKWRLDIWLDENQANKICHLSFVQLIAIDSLSSGELRTGELQISKA